MSKKGKFVSSGFGSSRPEAKGVWLPSMMPSCAGLAAKELTPYPTVAKNAFQEQSKQVFTSHPEGFLGSWLEGLDEPFTLPQMTGRRNSKSTLLAKVMLQITVQLEREIFVPRFSTDIRGDRGHSDCQ